ncbi:MAG: flagellar basal-body MS-ring/collar protein FliF [Acidimicrobiales bacterium]
MALVPAGEVDRVKEHLRRFASGFTPGQKAVTVIGVLAVLLGAVFFMNFASRPSYAPLFTGLQPTDAGSITQHLAADKVPYELANGGTTVLVPANQVDQQRLALAQAGLPTSGPVGLSLLDKVGITTSQFTQQADYQRALQGQLEQTIDAIHGVSGSIVDLAMPTQSAFAVTPPNPTGASVVVDLAPGSSLTPGEVQAIVHLVASSVPGLAPGEVTVADNQGDLLSGPGVQNAVSGQQSQTSAEDQLVASKVSSLLDGVLGTGNADVQVNSVLDFSKTTTTTHALQTTPAGTPITVPTQSTSSSQSLSGASSAAGGVLGTGVPALNATGPVTYTKKSSSASTAVGTIDTTTHQAPGSVTRESVAVLVNSKALKGMGPGAVKTLQSEVAAAAGINPARGDVLSFSAIPFSSAASAAAAKAAAAAAAADKRSQLFAMVRDGLLVLAVLVVLFLLWRSSKRASVNRAPVVLPRPMSFQPVPEAAALAAAATSQVPAVNLGSLGRGGEIRKDVADFIDSQPEDVAALLRNWMNEEQRSGTPKAAG